MAARPGRELLSSSSKLEKWRVPTHAAVVLTIYACFAILVLNPGFQFAGLLVWPFAGFVLAGFLNAAHDCIHRTHLPSRTANRVMGAVWCTPILVNFTLYKCQHLAHHRHTGVDGDTESHSTFATVRAYLYALTGISMWRQTILSILRTSKGELPASANTQSRKSGAKRDNWALCCWLFVAVALTFVFPRALLFAYWLPLAFYPAATLFLSLPEHYGLAGVPDLARNTRCVRSNRIVRFFMWNANYHADHHAFPYIPALKLHAFHKATTGMYCGNEESSYLGFHYKLLRSLLKPEVIRPGVR